MNPGSIIKLDNFEKTKSFFSQDDVNVEDKYRIRINPVKAVFPDSIPTPDIYIEATKITDQSNNIYFVFSNMMEPEVPAYIVPESLIVGAPELSKLGSGLTTDPAGSLNMEADIIRSIEHRELNSALEKEERDRGKIGVYSIEVDQSRPFPGQFPIDSSVVEARRVILNNTPYYVVNNMMDNYVRPDLITSEYLVSEPQVIRFETPVEDLAQKRKAERDEMRANSVKASKAADERIFEVEKTTRKTHIEVIKRLNSFIGNHIDIPSEITKENRGSRLEHAFTIVKALKKLESFKEQFKTAPQVAFNKSKGNIGEALIDIMNQIDREKFLKENGFFVQVDNSSSDIKINILDSEDIMIAQSVFDKSNSESQKVAFEYGENETHYDYIDLLTLNVDESGSATELGKPLDDEGKLESLWALLANVHLAEEWEDLPSLDKASFDGVDVYDIDDFDANDLIEIMSRDKEFMKDIKNEVSKVIEHINEIKDNSNTENDLDNAVGL